MMRWAGKITVAIVVCLALSGLYSPVIAGHCDCAPNCDANPSTHYKDTYYHQHGSCVKAGHDLSDRCCSVVKMESTIIAKPVRPVPGGLFPLGLVSRNIAGVNDANRLQRFAFECLTGELPAYLTKQTFRC